VGETANNARWHRSHHRDPRMPHAAAALSSRASLAAALEGVAGRWLEAFSDFGAATMMDDGRLRPAVRGPRRRRRPRRRPPRAVRGVPRVEALVEERLLAFADREGVSASELCPHRFVGAAETAEAVEAALDATSFPRVRALMLRRRDEADARRRAAVDMGF